MEHLPTWMILPALGALLVAAVLRRHDRGSSVVDRLALVLVAATVVAGVTVQPGQALVAFGLVAMVAAWAALVAGTGFALEALSGVLTRTSRAPRAPRTQRAPKRAQPRPTPGLRPS